MQVTASRIFLVGPMGAGKSTIGDQLARTMEYSYIDCDHELEARTGASISLIFDIEGESGFRGREKRLLDELTLHNDVVLATGGGAVLPPENRRRLIERGFVVYLQTPLKILVERTCYDGSRPLLHTPDPKQALGTILEEREPLYLETADLIVNTGRLSVKQIIREIVEALKA